MNQSINLSTLRCGVVGAISGSRAVYGRIVGAPPYRVLVATGAWRPRVNGVVRTLGALAQEAAR